MVVVSLSSSFDGIEDACQELVQTKFQPTRRMRPRIDNLKCCAPKLLHVNRASYISHRYGTVQRSRRTMR